MKKAILAFCFILAGMGVFAQNGIVKELSGTVELKKPGTDVYVAAKAGDSLNQSTVISTGFKSTAIIQVGSTEIAVRPLTRLTLTEISAATDTEKLNVNLQTGRVRVEVTPPAGKKASTTVASPSATASVRGTGFEFDTKNLFVEHGAVSFKGNRGAGMLVNAGASSQVSTEGKAANPIVIANNNLRPATPVGSGEVTGGAQESPSVSANPRTGMISIYLGPAE
ncbi:FecR domain-containing protein [Treponema sp. R6D11]